MIRDYYPEQNWDAVETPEGWYHVYCLGKIVEPYNSEIGDTIKVTIDGNVNLLTKASEITNFQRNNFEQFVGDSENWDSVYGYLCDEDWGAD